MQCHGFQHVKLNDDLLVQNANLGILFMNRNLDDNMSLKEIYSLNPVAGSQCVLDIHFKSLKLTL